jgi:hypothetical protein
MWADVALDANEELRQGDLTQGFVFPRLKLPFLAVQPLSGPGKETPQEEAPQLVVESKRGLHLVVSQCCTIENRRIVALAPVTWTPPLLPRLREALLADDPPEEGDDEGAYATDMFMLEPVAGVIEARENQFSVVDLNQIASFSGFYQVLRGLRVARMTPQARLRLRTKLAYYWSRAEKSDVEALRSQGGPA